jgi:AraC family transcriptional regulator, regulatory protein of adaptative response / DNA-3-methyladenine glycosylase II
MQIDSDLHLSRLGLSNADAAYAAVLARDTRFDGRLFVGVTSTGIYCRPICRVRAPKAANCRFFAYAAAAESAGFRPCLKCRPEIAPGFSLMEASDAVADQTLRLLQRALALGEQPNLAQLARRVGVSERHLRRAFSARFGVSPSSWWQTQRLLLAKQLLSDSTLPITQVALASGFASLRRFNSAFVGAYRMQPARLRAATRAVGALTAEPELSLRLDFRPPLDHEALFGFYQRHQVDGVERVEATRLRRSLALPTALGELQGWIELELSEATQRAPLSSGCLRLRVSPSLAPKVAELIARVRHGFDLDADPDPVTQMQMRMPVTPRPGLRLAGGFDGFEIALRIVLGQQIGVSQANALTARLVQRCGTPIATPWPEVQYLFPTPQQVAALSTEQLAALGMPRARAGAILALSRAITQGRVQLRRDAPVAETISALQQLPGLGDWSVQCIAMRALAWPDAFPATDVGLWRALGVRDSNLVRDQAEAWRPWRAYAATRLWHAAGITAPTVSSTAELL